MYHNQAVQIYKFYEAYLRAQARYLDKPTHMNWHRKEALLEAYQKALKSKRLA
jgi:hypothetical protein